MNITQDLIHWRVTSSVQCWCPNLAQPPVAAACLSTQVLLPPAPLKVLEPRCYFSAVWFWLGWKSQTGGQLPLVIIPLPQKSQQLLNPKPLQDLRYCLVHLWASVSPLCACHNLVVWASLFHFCVVQIASSYDVSITDTTWQSCLTFWYQLHFSSPTLLLIFFKLTLFTFMDWIAFFPNHITFAASDFKTGTSSSFFMSILSQMLSFSGSPNGHTDSLPTSITDLHYHFRPPLPPLNFECLNPIQ